MGVLHRLRRRNRRVAATEQADEPGHDGPSRKSQIPANMEIWGDQDAKVQVTQPEGFMMKVILQTGSSVRMIQWMGC